MLNRGGMTEEWKASIPPTPYPLSLSNLAARSILRQKNPNPSINQSIGFGFGDNRQREGVKVSQITKRSVLVSLGVVTSSQIL
jgi:hypothetical protein